MKKVSKLLLTLALIVSATAFSEAQTPAANAPMQGVVRVKLQKSVARQVGPTTRNAVKGKTVTTGVETIDARIKDIKGVSLKKVFPCPPGREAAHAAAGLDQWYEITFDESINPLEARRIMSEAAGVEKASIRRPIQLFDNGPAVEAKTIARASASMPFNDPRLSAQWHYNNDGSLGGSLAGADINLFEAWKISTGNPNIVIAVIDGGIDTSHEDLIANLWVNPGEIPGNGIDDDNNGYVDDVNGYNFCTDEGPIAAHQHGTHVAGTIAAVNGNGVGVCGVAGGNGTPGSGVKLMSVQVFDSRTGTGDPDVSRAIVYAADNGATVANCSWGWTEGYYDQDVLDAIKYFTEYAGNDYMRGGLCIFASGNEGDSGQIYPACMDEVLSVSSIGHDGRIVSYANYGEWVDIAAPGGLMDYSTYEGVLSTLPDGKYGYLQGTSMAAPHVTGIAALVLSKYGSATLTNQSLRTQIETSVNDLYSIKGNEELVGLHGSGYADAAKALVWGDGTAPDAPTDLKVNPAQDNITIEWTIPASSDNNINHHILYYSTAPFSADNLSGVKSVVIDTKYQSSGETVSYELTGLEPLTEYYLALVAVDRWGNASAMTDVVATRTNRGPQMTVATDFISINSDAANRIAKATLEIGNADEGLLKWESYLRNRNHSISYYSIDVPFQTAPYTGHLAIQPFSATAVAQVSEYTPDEYPKEITSMRSIQAFIGDSDKNVPNSMAQLFTVNADDYPNGFNLTTVCIEGAYGDNPTIEIYRGPAIMSDATRLLSWQPDFFYYGYNVSLPEQIFFEPGESFYVVVHFDVPQEKLYPLGLATALDGATDAPKAYMSNDLGQTWTLLAAALVGSPYEGKADQYTWAIRARSLNPDFSSMITLNPASGQVAAGESQAVEVIADGSKLINGTYRANIRFKTNESQANDIAVPVTLYVTDQQPDILFTKVVDFGSLVIGQSKTITIEVFNRGYGQFSNNWGQLTSSNISCTSDQFKAPTYLGAGFPARSTTKFDVTFQPTVAGSHSGQVIFTDKNGNQVKVMIQGTATEAPKIAIDPAEGVEVGDLEIGGDSKDVSFAIKNEGKYPLQFVMPKYSDDQIDDIKVTNNHRFGYSYISNLKGSDKFEYQPMEELTDAVDVTSQFGDYTYFTKAVKLGFDFPYFGKTYDEVYITSFGGVAMEPYTEGLIFPPLYEKTYYVQNTGLISIFGSSQLMMGPNSRVEYAKKDGKFIVNYKDVLAVVYDQDYTPVSFHLALCPNGDVEMYWDSFNPMDLFQNCTGLFVALLDPDNVDHFIVTSSTISNGYFSDESSWTEEGFLYREFVSGTALRFVAPKPNMITSVSPVIGVIAPGEQTEVSVNVKANDEMYAGPTYTDLFILTNDPENPSATVRFNANIIGDLNPEFTLLTEALDFGDVFRTANVSRPVAVKNTGRADMQITAVALANNNFTVQFAEPVTVPAGQSKDIIVTIPTENEGAVADVMTITTTAGEKSLNIAGNVIGCPDIQLSYSEVAEAIDYGTIKPIPLTVTNTGNAPLGYTVTPGNFVDYAPTFNADSKITYKWTASVDDDNARREWINNQDDSAAHYGFTYFMEHSYVEVQLPFEFPYYDSKYSTMYIYNTGFVTFNKRSDDASWPEPPAEFPAGSVFRNLIAPYWGLHSMDQTLSSGVYYSTTDDAVVVTFVEYGNALNIGVNYQVILYKDGSFTYNYKANNDNAVIYSLFGVAGYVNPDGDQGVSLPERCVQFGESVNFIPVVTNSLPAGESVDLDLKLNASPLAGVYNSDIVITTDIPATPKVQIPVTMTVLGEALPVFPEDIVVEHPAGYHSTDTSDWWIQQGAVYYTPIVIENHGSAAFTIDNIEFESAMLHDYYFDYDYPAFMLFYYGETEDFETGETVNTWMQYNGMPITVGKEPVKLVVPMLPNDAFVTPGTYENVLYMDISGVDGLSFKELKVTYVVTEAPIFMLDKDEIRVTNTTDDTVVTEKVTLSNYGDYKLVYDFYLDSSGNGENDGTDDEGGVAPLALNASAVDASTLSLVPASSRANSIVPFETGASTNYLNTPQQGEYTNYLYWDAMPANANTAYAFGTGDTYSECSIAVAYTAPEEGFNVSHAYFLLAPNGMGGKNIKVEVVTGDLDGDYNVLGTGSYALPAEIDEQYPVGALSMAVTSLRRPVYIAPNQDFYIVVTFPAGSPRPVALVQKVQEVVDGRYLINASVFGGWLDIARSFEDQYGPVGFVCTALQTVEGRPWAELVTEQREGVLEPGESTDIELRLTAATAPMDRDNKVVVVFHSNDPGQPTVNFPVYLDRNAAPSIVAAADNVFVNEGETIDVQLTVYDMDGDDFAIRVDDAHPAAIATISSVTAVDPAESCTINEFDTANHFYEVLGSTSGVNVNVTIAPQFGHAGDYSFTLTALDSDNHSNDTTVNYTVGKINHAPVAADNFTLEVGLGTTSEPINLYSLFTDPDGDTLTFEIKTIENVISIAGTSEIYKAGSSIIVYGVKKGRCMYDITATDESGASATLRLTVAVKEAAGIENIIVDASTDVYPNPFVDQLFVTLDFDAPDARYAIYNIAGELVVNETANALAGEPHALSVGQLPAGVYILRIEALSRTATRVLLKN